jgi:hypothetical protein
MSLYPRVGKGNGWKKATRRTSKHPDTTGRRNTFVPLFYPKRDGFIFNTYEKRRSREFRHYHLQNIINYTKRHSVKKVILFIGHAHCHKTKNVKKFIRRHK